jgi:hypothetical protein
MLNVACFICKLKALAKEQSLAVTKMKFETFLFFAFQANDTKATQLQIIHVTVYSVESSANLIDIQNLQTQMFEKCSNPRRGFCGTLSKLEDDEVLTSKTVFFLSKTLSICPGMLKDITYGCWIKTICLK